MVFLVDKYLPQNGCIWEINLYPRSVMNTFGEIQIYTKFGSGKILDYETTVRLCSYAPDKGVCIDEIIKREIELELKTLRFILMNEHL